MRECGECVVCCVYPQIVDPDLKKEGMRECPNLDLPQPPDGVCVELQWRSEGCKNCKVYDNQPKQCASYNCAWREGHGAEEDRPDKSLMLFDRSKGIMNSLEAKPLRRNQQDSTVGIAAIERMGRSHGTPVIVLGFYERRIRRIEGRSV